MGISVKGSGWKRPNDILGIGAVINGISKNHREFLKEGGYGFLIGDGKLTYSPEQIIECYYEFKLNDFFWLTIDYQFARNPAYNNDRGPVNVFGLRGHVEF